MAAGKPTPIATIDATLRRLHKILGEAETEQANAFAAAMESDPCDETDEHHRRWKIELVRVSERITLHGRALRFWCHRLVNAIDNTNPQDRDDLPPTS